MQFKLNQPIFVLCIMNYKRIIAYISDEDSFIHIGQRKR